MIRVAIADDHEIVRNGLIMLIDQEKDMEVQVEASSCTELISKLKKECADLLILDLNLGDKMALNPLKMSVIFSLNYLYWY